VKSENLNKITLTFFPLKYSKYLFFPQNSVDDASQITEYSSLSTPPLATPLTYTKKMYKTH